MGNPKHTLIAIDVDGTLIDHKGELLPGVKEKIITWFEHNTLWCWSHGGKDYARKVLKQHDLLKYFPKVLDKPFYYLDDLPECGMFRLN